MQIKTKKVEFYFGRGVGMVLESLLAKAKKRVWIVSPWISEKYARALNKLADKGVDVKVVTSDDTGNHAHRRALRELIGLRKMEVSEVVHKKRDELLLAAAVIGLVGLLQIFSNWLLGVLLILAAAGMLFIYMGVDRVDYQLAPQLVPDPKIHLQIYNWGGGDEQLHSKIYIIDNVAVVGSANLTESGLFRNIEFVAVIRDPALLEDIEELFDELREHPIWEARTISDVFEDVYADELHPATQN